VGKAAWTSQPKAGGSEYLELHEGFPSACARQGRPFSRSGFRIGSEPAELLFTEALQVISGAAELYHKVLGGLAMCGRYVRRGDKQKLADHFHAQSNPAELAMPDADYNVAPTTHQPIIRQSRESGEREMVLARWGLIPFFTKDLSEIRGLSTINARAESITKAST